MDINPRILYIIFSLIFFAGCRERGSEELDTHQIRVSYNISSNGNNELEISASFSHLKRVIDGYIPDSETVRLEKGDRLTARSSGKTKDFMRDFLVSGVAYNAELDFDEGKPEIEITLNRPSKSETLISTIDLAPNMEFVSPTEAETFQADDPINIQWQPALPNKRITFCISTDCLQRHSLVSSTCESIEDIGMFETSFSSFFRNLKFKEGQNESCQAILSLSRYTEGSLASGFSPGSRLSSSQHRSKNIEIIR